MTLGNLDLEEDRGRLLVALAGLALALAMAVLIVSSALRVLEPLPLYVKDVVGDPDLAQELNRRPERLPGSWRSHMPPTRRPHPPVTRTTRLRLRSCRRRRRSSCISRRAAGPHWQRGWGANASAPRCPR